MSTRVEPKRIDYYAKFFLLSTRWNDNDIYGHLNNVIYFELFDTAINRFLIENDLLCIEKSKEIGLVVDNRCTYFSSIKFPDLINVGIKVEKIGRTSVTYEIGIFKNDEKITAAIGKFVHVYVDRYTNRPVNLPEKLRTELLNLII